MFKGTVPQDFLSLVFFFKLFLLGPVDMPRNYFHFIQLFAEIFNYFGASPVSMTLAKNYSLVSLTPAKHAFAGVIDTSKACIRQCQ
jgi:hypothetical protein